MGKCDLFSFVLKIILLRHKVGLCLHGHLSEYGADIPPKMKLSDIINPEAFFLEK